MIIIIVLSSLDLVPWKLYYNTGHVLYVYQHEGEEVEEEKILKDEVLNVLKPKDPDL